MYNGVRDYGAVYISWKRAFGSCCRAFAYKLSSRQSY